MQKRTILAALLLFIFMVLAMPIIIVISAKLLAPAGFAIPPSISTADKADLAFQQIQNILNAVNLVVALMGIFLAIVAFGIGALGFFGFTSIGDIRKDVEESKKEALDEIRKDINLLQQEMSEKLADLKKIQDDLELKNQESSRLLQDLSKLHNQLSNQVATTTKEVEDVKTAITYLILGNQLAEDNKLDQAIMVYEKARNLRPEDSQINYDLGRTYSDTGQYNKAITCLEIAIKSDPTFAQAELELGLAYRYRADTYKDPTLKEQDYNLCEQHLTRATEIVSSYTEALGSLGGLYRRRDDYQKALHYYKLTHEADKNSSYGTSNVASLSWYLGNLNDAQYYYQQTIERINKRIGVPGLEIFWDYYDLAQAQLVLAQITQDNKLREKAFQNYEIAINKTPPRKKHYETLLRNLYLLRDSRNREAITSLDTIIARLEQEQSQL